MIFTVHVHFPGCANYVHKKGLDEIENEAKNLLQTFNTRFVWAIFGMGKCPNPKPPKMAVVSLTEVNLVGFLSLPSDQQLLPFNFWMNFKFILNQLKHDDNLLRFRSHPRWTFEFGSLFGGFCCFFWPLLIMTPWLPCREVARWAKWSAKIHSDKSDRAPVRWINWPIHRNERKVDRINYTHIVCIILRIYTICHIYICYKCAKCYKCYRCYIGYTCCTCYTC